MLIAAYSTIKSKPGMMTKGSDEITFDGISKEWFEEQSKIIQSEQYQPKPSRREFIPKPNGKTRPLGISSPRDRIIQQSMKMVMECMIDPTFLDSSHGFRPRRSCHSALKEIRSWKGVTWFIEGDIKAFFDNIDHQILAQLINKHFRDTRLLNLYWKFVKAGYMEWDQRKIKYVASDVGVPQGGIVSPLLSNLILHELDVYVKELSDGFENLRTDQKKSLMNPKYLKAVRLVKKLKDSLKDVKKGSAEYRLTKRKIRSALCAQRTLNSQIPHPKLHPTIKYVRYADDWLIGVWGDKKFADMIKNKMRTKLEELRLTLSEEKTLITNARTEMAKFLGTHIKKFATNRGTIFVKNKSSKQLVRIPGGNIRMTAPISSIIKKLEQKGFLVGSSTKWEMKSIWKFLPLPMKDIILRYRSVYHGYSNFYSFVDNKKMFSKIYWILKISLRKTLSRKFNVSKHRLTKKYGQHLNCNYQTSQGINKYINFQFPPLTRDPMAFKVGNIDFKDPLYAGLWNVRSINGLHEVCASCGTESGIEMHHLKHIKTINPRLNSFDKLLARINRKQVPLCNECHHKVHVGKYEGTSLRFLAGKGKNKNIL